MRDCPSDEELQAFLTATLTEAQTEAPPPEEGTTLERRTGPADRREAQAQA